MKLPSAPVSSTEFKNSSGSSVPKEFAIEARKNPEIIKQMAETPKEKSDLEKEALFRQYVLIVDRSGSMSWPDVGGGCCRWESAQKAVEKIVEKVFVYDSDGKVPLYLFDHEVEFVGECVSSSQVCSIFTDYKPRGTTDLAKCLETAMETYVGKNRNNGAIVPGSTFIVILDGATDDSDAVKAVLRKFADPANGFVTNHTQVAVSFVQIGDIPVLQLSSKS